ncbi:MAG: helix-turn-helix transcriptional regulator [Firmicutes bacterium]|nr:helix-turn-helix transcriptional regulator [Bacillota bacterium]
MLKHIEENYNKKLTLNELARSSFYNPSYFSRIFKECYGKILTEYISEKRLEAFLSPIPETLLKIKAWVMEGPTHHYALGSEHNSI